MERPAFTIGAATPDDLGALASVDRETFGDEAYPAFFFRQAHDLWPDGLRVAVWPSGEVAGYVLAAVAARPHEAWILSTAVGPSHRGRGVGEALMRDVLTALAGHGVRTVRLTVHPENGGAVRLYERLGFRTEREEAAYFGPAEPRLVMARPLDDAAR